MNNVCAQTLHFKKCHEYYLQIVHKSLSRLCATPFYPQENSWVSYFVCCHSDWSMKLIIHSCSSLMAMLKAFKSISCLILHIRTGLWASQNMPMCVVHCTKALWHKVILLVWIPPVSPLFWIHCSKQRHIYVIKLLVTPHVFDTRENVRKYKC